MWEEGPREWHDTVSTGRETSTARMDLYSTCLEKQWSHPVLRREWGFSLLLFYFLSGEGNERTCWVSLFPCCLFFGWFVPCDMIYRLCLTEVSITSQVLFLPFPPYITSSVVGIRSSRWDYSTSVSTQCWHGESLRYPKELTTSITQKAEGVRILHSFLLSRTN